MKPSDRISERVRELNRAHTPARAPQNIEHHVIAILEYLDEAERRGGGEDDSSGRGPWFTWEPIATSQSDVYDAIEAFLSVSQLPETPNLSSNGSVITIEFERPAEEPAGGDGQGAPLDVVKTLSELAECARAWEPDVSLLGNLRAADIAVACSAGVEWCARLTEAVADEKRDGEVEAFRRAQRHNEYVNKAYQGGGFNDRSDADRATVRLLDEARAIGAEEGQKAARDDFAKRGYLVLTPGEVATEIRELKEKLAAAEAAYASMVESHRSAMESMDLCVRERQEAESAREEAERKVRELDGRRRESRQLLQRFVTYAREDRAETKGTTRLARLVEGVADYLSRTSDPSDILRSESADEEPIPSRGA